MPSNHSEQFPRLSTDSKMSWLDACQWLEQNGEGYCIATIVAQAGSVPRSTGSKMVISANHQFDTLGGGKLEHMVIAKARQQLIDQHTSLSIERFSLAADMQQCCGGAVQVMLEFINCQQPNVVIYGAGHVSQALCRILKHLPCQVKVIDNRQQWAEQISAMGIPSLQHNTPVATLATLKANSLVLIMTHDHALDFELTKAALERDCFPYIGLIGSQGKKQRFEFRLKEQLSNTSLLAGLTCPIGHADINGKLPMQVAVSVSAQLMALFAQIETTNQEQEQEQEQHANKETQWQQANIARKTITEAQNGK